MSERAELERRLLEAAQAYRQTRHDDPWRHWYDRVDLTQAALALADAIRAEQEDQ